MVKKKDEKRSKGVPSGSEGKEEGLDFDFGIGKIGLGGLFNGIGKLVDLAAELKEEGGEIKKEGEIDLSHLKKGMKGVFGFSVKTAVGGKPIVEPFGNIKKTPKGPTVEEEREPIIDVFDEKEEIRIYAEMPGVNQEDIKLDFPAEAGSCQGREKGEDILDITARTGDRKYHKEVLLPAKVNPESLTSSYKNGILEIKINKC